jgi:CBS domain-containing protein
VRVSDAMTTTVVTASPGTPFQRLVDLMLHHGVSGLPIVDDARRPIGIVTEADLVSKEAYGARRRPLDVAAAFAFRQENVWAVKARGLTAGAIMTTPVRTVRPDDQLRLAAARMVTMGVKRLPVVGDDGRLVGIVTRTDVLRLFYRSDDEVALGVQRLLDDPLLVPEEHDVTASVHDGVVTLTGSVSRDSHAALSTPWCARYPAWSTSSTTSQRGDSIKRAAIGRPPCRPSGTHRWPIKVTAVNAPLATDEHARLGVA